MAFLNLINRYNESHNKAASAYTGYKAAEYRMQTGQYKKENARLQLEISIAKLNAFIKAYSKEEGE